MRHHNNDGHKNDLQRHDKAVNLLHLNGRRGYETQTAETRREAQLLLR